MQSAVVGRALASFLSMEILNLVTGDLVTIFDVSVLKANSLKVNH
jgi:hypothetical protein